MSNLSKYFTPPAKTPVVLVTSASCESHIATLRQALPNLAITAKRAQSLGLETQQLQVAERQAMIEGVQNQLEEYSRKHPDTGPVHVYLLDGKGLAAGDPDSQATLHALASAAINDPTHTVAALVPEDEHLKHPGLPDGTPNALAGVVKQFLDDTDVATVESFDALIEKLAQL